MEKLLSSWKLDTLGEVKAKKKKLLAWLAGIQRHLHNGQARGFLVRLENKLHQELKCINTQEELLWFQRSRAKWVMSGDRNTSYYHLKTVSRRRRNRILVLRDDNGKWIEEEENVKDMVNMFYKNLFAGSDSVMHRFQTRITYPVVDAKLMADLALPIGNMEIKYAIFSMGSWKAPRLDGFSAGFYQQTWSVVAHSMCVNLCVMSGLILPY